jgi:lipoprotein-anchoring transpeptidase ErfK/SrfK
MTTAGTDPSWTPWSLSVNLAARVLTVSYQGHIARRFIEEGVALASQASGAPYALATSARSDILRRFDGGPGQIAIHGMTDLPGALGTASSHGCIRLDTVDITWLAMRIGPGVPLTILAGHSPRT